MKKIIALLAVVAMIAALCCACGTTTDTSGTDAGADTPKTKVIDIALSEEEYAYCVAKDNTELLTKVNEYLAKIKEDGTLDDILNKYFGDGTPAQIESAAKDASKDQLVVATATGFEPFEMVDAGKYSGVDLEIAAGLAEYMGVELVIEDMQFASVVTSVQSGICDIGMAGMTVTEKRLEVVSFSDKYYSANQVLIVPGNNTEFDDCKTADEVAAILDTKDASTKIGCQIGTTGALYIEGDAEDDGGYGFPGLKVTQMGYDYAALAITAMVQGEIDYVIVDDAPAKAITKGINGK